MKVTAIIDDKTIEEAMKYSKASTITEALKIALKDYITLQKLKDLGQMTKSEPMKFSHSVDKIRNTNRKV